jgi:tRNA-modifying protein YgfZ
MKQTALYDSLPPEKIPGVVQGFSTALSFGDPASELRSAVAGEAVTDRSMLGRIEVTGADRLDLLHRLSTNGLAGLRSGETGTTVFVTDKGRVIDHVTVSVREDSLVLITSPGSELFLTHWIGKYTITEDITLKIVTDDTIMVSLVGPRMISTFCDAAGAASGNQGSATLVYGGISVHFVQTPGKDVAHLITENANAPGLARMVQSLPGARWIGWMAYDGYRILKGTPASPGEINDSHNPLECGLRGSVSFTKGCYIGQEVIARLDTYGKTRRHLVQTTSASALHEPLPVSLVRNGGEAGMLTSMSEIPLDGVYAGLAIIRNESASPGDTLLAGTAAHPLLVAGTHPGT